MSPYVQFGQKSGWLRRLPLEIEVKLAMRNSTLRPLEGRTRNIKWLDRNGFNLYEENRCT